ncbi:MAG: outer membrane protein transport protein [Kiritimatiellales bacterium]|nr:outer membrane protein transport protein [Kiritimatiellales bacterium]
MQKRALITGFKYVYVSLLAVLVGSLYADGYRNPPPTAEGIGKSGANMVFADDASAIFYNPANLAFQTNVSVVLNATFARSENTYENGAGQKAVSDDPWQVLPNLFVSVPLDDGVTTIGLGITTPYGQSIKYNQNDLVNIPSFMAMNPPAIHEAEISLINFNPTIAFKLGDRVGIGVGADIYYSTLKFKQFYPWSVIPLGPDQEAEAEADGYGFGGNAGITWNFMDRQSLAFTYRSEVKVEYEGDLDVTPGGTNPFQLVNSDFEMDIRYPTVLGIGYGIGITETIRLEANLEWLEWSVNETQKADLGANGSMSVPQKWKDTVTVGVGGDWQFANNWVLRAGYAFIESPIPDETISPILPDVDRHVLSLGLGYTYKNHTLDIAYAYSIYADRDNSGNATALAAGYPGEYDIDSDLLGLTYSLTF